MTAKLQCPKCKSTDIGKDEKGFFCKSCMGPVSTSNTVEANGKNPKIKAKDNAPRRKSEVKKAAVKPVKKKKTGPAKASSENPYGSKLNADSATKIESMLLEGKSWKEVAIKLGVTVNSVRFRLLSHLMDKTYGNKIAKARESEKE